MNQYIEKEKEPPSEAMLLGNAVHMALETWMAEEGKDIGDLFDVFTASLAVVRKVGPISGDEEEAARTMLMDYYDKLDKVDKGLVLAVEEMFQLPLNACIVTGVIDRAEYLDDSKDTVVLVDYKSGRYATTQAKLRTNMQLAVYTYYAKQKWPAKYYVAELHYPRLDKVLRHTFTDEELETQIKDMDKTAIDIKYDDQFLPKGSPFACGSCGFVHDCGWGRVQYKIYTAIKRKAGEEVLPLKPKKEA